MTGDEAFLREYGAEILVETARFWVDLGGYTDRQERRFCINGVTGPDEYTAVVNNNYFTNVMARENLRYACETVRSCGPGGQMPSNASRPRRASRTRNSWSGRRRRG